MRIDVAGLPAGLAARTFDPAVDFPAVVELIWAVSSADEHEEFPSAEELAQWWRLDRGFDPTRDVLLVEDGNRVVGLAAQDWAERSAKIVHWTEIWVHPDRRRQGLGRAIVGWAEANAAQLVRDGVGGPAELPHVLGLGAVDSNAGANAFAASLDYTPIRYGFVMRRQLDEPIPDRPLPEGIEIRPVRPEDHRVIWDADVEAFLDHWEPRVRTEEDFVATYDGPNVDTALWRVAWDGHQVAGSVQNQINPVESERLGIRLGWLEHVSVRRAWRGRGIASALIVESLRALKERGVEVAALGVDGENLTGALGLYQRLGFRRHIGWIAYRKPLP
jgi:mycothiol synthase